VVVVVQFKILSGIMITILCAVLVFQSTVVASMRGYAISIQPVSTPAEATSGVSSSLNPPTITSTFNATFNNSNDNYSFFSTYTNTKYGIKLQYPYNWVIEADDYATGAAGQAGIQIASFYLPDVNNGLPFFRIGTDDLTKEFPNLQKVSINQYLHRSLAHKNSTGFPGFNLIESDTSNRRLADNLAYTVVWTYIHPTYGMRKSIEIATILGSRGYFVDYTAATTNFSRFLPVAEKMIESFQKTK
jgi:hypothetical protein